MAEHSLPKSQWCNLLYRIEFAINSNVAESTGRSLFEMVYGEQIKLPIDVTVGTQGKMPDATRFAQHIQQVIKDAKNHLKRAQDYQKLYFDKHHRLQEHLVGERVLLSSKTLYLVGTRKLSASYVGPFRVMECIGKAAYRLDLVGRFKQVYNIFHVS